MKGALFLIAPPILAWLIFADQVRAVAAVMVAVMGVTP